MDKIKLCRECGKPFEGEIWDSYCKECNERFEREERMEQAAAGEEIWCSGNIICPWCDCEFEPDFEDPDYYRDGDHIMKCPDCGKTYCLNVSISYSYTSCRVFPKYLQEELDRQKNERVRRCDNE